MKDNLTPKEMAYYEYLRTPRTTAEMTEQFDAKQTTAWQMIRTLRLKKLVHHTWNGFWKITEDSDDVPPIQITPLQRDVLQYLREPHRTSDVMEHFDKGYQSAIQVIRTLRLMELVESVEICGATGSGGCWFMWQTTDRGTEEIGAE